MDLACPSEFNDVIRISIAFPEHETPIAFSPSHGPSG